MITPHPTTKIDPAMARGVFVGTAKSKDGGPGHIVFGVPNTSYELHLMPQSDVGVQPGRRLIGTIRVRARRIDKTTTGGQFIEPVYGRPRRVQGTVVRVLSDCIVVDAGVPLHLTPTDPRQKPGDFAEGDFVGCDVMDGATFTRA